MASKALSLGLLLLAKDVHAQCSGGAAPTTGTQVYTLAGGATQRVVAIPSGVTNLDFALLSNDVDIDVQFNRVDATRTNGGQCLVGFACTVTGGSRTVSGMAITFSGDDISTPVIEEVTIDVVTQNLYLYIKNYASRSGVVALTYTFCGTIPELAPASTPTPTTPTTPLVGGLRDPHLFLAHGERTDFRGDDKTWYNMLSAKNTTVNAFFENADFHLPNRLVHGSFMGRVAMVVRTALTGQILSIEFNASDSRAHVRTHDVDQYVTHMSGEFQLENVKVVFREKKMGSNGHGLALTISTGRWDVLAWSKPFPNAGANVGRNLLNVKIDATYDADRDPVAPHGLIGQSYDGDDLAVDGAVDSYRGKEVTTKAMGEGAIEGTANDYIMPSALATSFKYSRFDSLSAQPRDVAKLTGTKTKRKYQHASSTGATADVEEDSSSSSPHAPVLEALLATHAKTMR